MIMDEAILERAKDLGRLLGQTPEFRTLRRAREQVDEEQELKGLLQELGELEGKVAAAVQQGENPSSEMAEQYEQVFSKVQSSSVYQSLVAAQSNFDRVLGRVNEEIGKGMEAAAASGIIIPS